jgi:hypothetical protein
LSKSIGIVFFLLTGLGFGLGTTCNHKEFLPIVSTTRVESPAGPIASTCFLRGLPLSLGSSTTMGNFVALAAPVLILLTGRAFSTGAGGSLSSWLWQCLSTPFRPLDLWCPLDRERVFIQQSQVGWFYLHDTGLAESLGTQLEVPSDAGDCALGGIGPGPALVRVVRSTESSDNPLERNSA